MVLLSGYTFPMPSYFDRLALSEIEEFLALFKTLHACAQVTNMPANSDKRDRSILQCHQLDQCLLLESL